MSAEVVVFEMANWSVRTVLVDGEPWFVAGDVARALGYRDAANMCRRLDPSDRGTHLVSTPGGSQVAGIVSEPGLYTAVLGSQLSSAREFRRWITVEVLPTLRRTGHYSTVPAGQWEIPSTYAAALRAAAEQAERADAAVAALEAAAPMVALAENLIVADGDLSLREAAQILDRDPSISTGQNRLLGTLVEFGWVDRRGRLPYQTAINTGRLAVRTHTYDHPTEGPKVSTQVRVTPKGLAELHARLGGTGRLSLFTRTDVEVLSS